MRRKEEGSENTLSWHCHQMRLHHLNQTMSVIVKKGQFLLSEGCLCIFQVLVSGHQV